MNMIRSNLLKRILLKLDYFLIRIFKKLIKKFKNNNKVIFKFLTKIHFNYHKKIKYLLSIFNISLILLNIVQIKIIIIIKNQINNTIQINHIKNKQINKL
jgi:hypothetical protein